jgi:hypothetical protein
LDEAKLGILSHNWLENRNTNINKFASRKLEVTKQLSHTRGEPVESIYKAFSDFRLVAQIREEIERVKPSLAFTEVTAV